MRKSNKLYCTYRSLCARLFLGQDQYLPGDSTGCLVPARKQSGTQAPIKNPKLSFETLSFLTVWTWVVSIFSSDCLQESVFCRIWNYSFWKSLIRNSARLFLGVLEPPLIIIPWFIITIISCVLLQCLSHFCIRRLIPCVIFGRVTKTDKAPWCSVSQKQWKFANKPVCLLPLITYVYNLQKIEKATDICS